MQIIEFSVINQRVRCESETGIIANSRGLVHASFVFDAEWEGCGITVTFDNTEYSGEPISQGWTGEAIEIPPEVLIPGQLLISCVGVKNDGAFRIPTYEMRPGVKIYQSGHLFGIMPDSVTPSMVEQLMAAAGKALDAASAAEHTAADLEAARNNGEFTGPAGPAGPRGEQGIQGEPGPQGKTGEPGPGVDVDYDEETGTVSLVHATNGGSGDGSGEAGQDGRGIVSVTYDAETDTLTVHYTDNTSEELAGFGTWMKANQYDPDGAVAAAGGIAAYVEKSETWTFVLKDGTSVIKEVRLK